MLHNSNIVATAIQNYQAALKLPTADLPQHSALWNQVAEMHKEFILACKTPEQAIEFAQKSNFYDHRIKKHRPSFTYQYFENVLYNIHPSKRDLMPKFEETPVSHLGSVMMNNPLYKNTRLVSTSLFIHASFILSCLEYKNDITRVCELGGGYGDIARLWMTTPQKKAALYFIVDLPESLFFAEVFLKTVLPETKLTYLKNEQEVATLAKTMGTEPQIVLCPVPLHAHTSPFKFDILINTLSLGEMTQDWVEFWSKWMDKQSVNLFYSSNNFGSELDRMFECESTLSPVMPSNWIMTKYSTDHPYQVFWSEYTRKYAELFFERTPDNKPRPSTLADFYKIRKNTKFTLNDIIFCVYNLDDQVNVELESTLLKKFVTDMTFTPKELLYWFRRVARSPQFKTASSESRPFIEKQLALLETTFKNQKENVLFQNEKTIIEQKGLSSS